MINLRALQKNLGEKIVCGRLDINTLANPKVSQNHLSIYSQTSVKKVPPSLNCLALLDVAVRFLKNIALYSLGAALPILILNLILIRYAKLIE